MSRWLLTVVILALATPCVAVAADAKCSIHPAKGTPKAQLAKLAKISQDEAERIARGALKGVKNASVAGAELEVERGCLIWSFDLKVPGKSGVEEVQVDAGDGKVLSSVHEGPRKEAAEQRAAPAPTH